MIELYSEKRNYVTIKIGRELRLAKSSLSQQGFYVTTTVPPESRTKKGKSIATKRNLYRDKVAAEPKKSFRNIVKVCRDRIKEKDQRIDRKKKKKECYNISQRQRLNTLSFTHPHPLLAASVPTTPHKSSSVSFND